MPVITGRDCIAQAQSGTGKTVRNSCPGMPLSTTINIHLSIAQLFQATFSIAALQRIDDTKCSQCIILSPTRELAVQTSEVVTSLSSHMENVRVHACIGGTSKAESAAQLRGGCQVVVGTPGRVIDMIKSRILNVAGIRMLILDEADEMLSMGFMDQIREVVGLIPETSQIAIFSATLPPEALDMTRMFMQDPIRILVQKEALTLQGLKQFYVALPDARMKFDTIADIYGHLNVGQTVIFCNTRREVDSLADYMTEQDFTVSVLHAGLTSEERTATMQAFRTGASRVLITSNVLARGIDVQQVSLVINFSVCKDVSTYIHRVGRSARYGRKGVAINFITPRDVGLIRSIESYYQTQIDELPTFRALSELNA